ncbi:MAG: hypothetical protein HFE51_09790 [Clostridia bacterium]|nr:hypothetical protein [Clostridia bacterium]NDO20295.1 hypothetical protein [Lachnospiraceae bacterium MD329]
MHPREVSETFSKEEIEQFKADGYTDRDLIGLVACKKMLNMGLSQEEMYLILFQSLSETLEEHYGSEVAEKLKENTQLYDMIANGEIDIDDIE